MGHKRTRPKPQRLRMAKDWLSSYGAAKTTANSAKPAALKSGANRQIVKSYKKKFAVDILTAISDLQELGVILDPAYITAVQNSEKHRYKQLQEKKQEKLMEQHDLEIMYEELGVWDYIYDGYNDDIDVISNHRINFENRIGTVKKAGKNHVKVNGTLLQTNKKWSHLKQKQRDWIYEVVRTEHKKFIEENNRLPMKTGKKKLIEVIEAKIDERNIWLPSHELEKNIGKYIDKLNRRTDLEVDDEKRFECRECHES